MTVHRLSFDDNVIACLERSLLGWATILRATGDFRPTDLTKAEADLIARTAALVQEHRGHRCDCPPSPPVLGGSH